MKNHNTPFATKCNECQLYLCRHRREEMAAVGEPEMLANDLSDDYLRARVAEASRNETIRPQPTEPLMSHPLQRRRVLIAPPAAPTDVRFANQGVAKPDAVDRVLASLTNPATLPRASSVTPNATQNGTSTPPHVTSSQTPIYGPLTQKTPNTQGRYGANYDRTFADKDAKKWMECKVCGAQAMIMYFDEHIKVHTTEFAKANPIGRIGPQVAMTVAPKAPEPPPRPQFPKITHRPTYRFKQIEKAVAMGTTSTDHRYSDFTVVFLLERRASAYQGSYSGGSAQMYQDNERLVCHVVYDCQDDYFTLSCKLLRRGSHSTYDTEEAQVPERVCYQEELSGELHRALLYLGINPRHAWLHFRRMLRDQVQLSTPTEQGRVLWGQTVGHAEFVETMKKPAYQHGWSQKDADTLSCYG